MCNFITFLKHLFFSKKQIPSIQDMEFISSQIDKNGVETIIHGKGKYKIELKINKNLNEKKGEIVLKADKEINVTEEDIIWLMQRYI